MSSKAIATLVKIIESLPENMQDQIAAYLQEYIQQLNITPPANANGNLEIAVEVTNQQVKTGFDWEEFRRRGDSLPEDPNPMTMEEVCELA